MPNFDGTNLLKRGRVIGQEIRTWKKSTDKCLRKDSADIPQQKEAPAE
jgi:hypothetical protein